MIDDKEQLAKDHAAQAETDCENRRAGRPRETCHHLEADGTFRDGFKGCVLHRMEDCGGNHSKESATRICGHIAHHKTTEQ